MRATHWLIGCAVCIVGLGSATAASLDAQDLNTSTHAAMDSAPTRESNAGSGGDALGLSHESSPSSSSSSDSSGSPSGSGSNEHSGTTSPAPTPTRRPHLGWQSLLPGSIQ
ncbi:MAG: hypothetical protein WC617_11655 [Rhodanobacter sp.]